MVKKNRYDINDTFDSCFRHSCWDIRIVSRMVQTMLVVLPPTDRACLAGVAIELHLPNSLIF